MLKQHAAYLISSKPLQLDDNGTGVSACVGHISGNDTLGVPAVCKYQFLGQLFPITYCLWSAAEVQCSGVMCF
jgi:hypothetical protein